MSVLKLNGIEIDGVISVSDLKHATRDIGAREIAADGSRAITRSARKFDEYFTTVLLTLAAAQTWLAFFTGEGEAWNFDASLYGSKGTGPSSSTNTTASAGSTKYGAGKLSVGGTTGTITWAGVTLNASGGSVGWTVMVWREESGTYHHYVVRSSGAKWVDGVRNDAASTTWLSVSGGNVTIANATGFPVLYDDLVVLPFDVLDDWPAQIYAAGVAYGPVPVLNATGDLVTEQTTRQVVGTAKEGPYVKLPGEVMKVLTVELGAR